MPKPARAHPQGDEGPRVCRQALSRQPQQRRGDGAQGLPLRRRPARAGRPRRHHHPRQARGRGAGALRQGRRAVGGRAEQRLRRGRRRRGRGHAGRDPRHRAALRHGRDGSQLRGLRQYGGGALPHLQPGHGGERAPAAAARSPARPAGRHGAERRHRLCLLRSWARQGAVVSLRRHDRQRGLPGGARLRRLHPRRGQDRRAAAAAGGHQEPRDLPARGREGAERGQARSSSTRSASRRPARARPPRTRRRWPATMPPTRRCSSATG